MSKYRKLIVALVGAVVAVASVAFDVPHLTGMEDEIVVAIVTLLTALGVERVANETDPTAEAQNVAKAAAKEVLERLQGGRR